jgi:tight adherence protein B
MVGSVWLAVLLGAGMGGALWLMITGIRGTTAARNTVDPTRPPTRTARFGMALRSPGLSGRVLGGVTVAAVTLAVTRWPVAAVGLGALVLCWPGLFGGTAAEQRQIASLEALVTWTETLRDTIAAHASLEQAIPASAVNAPPLIRPALVALVGRLRARVPMEQALRAFAADLDDPSADLVIAALMLSATRRGDRLGEVLTGLTTAAREELEMRRKISAGRVELRRGVQIVVGVTIAIGVFLVVFSGSYIAPYGTPAGQVALAVVVGIFAAAFLWMRTLSAQHHVAPFLARPGQHPDPVETRLLASVNAESHPGAVGR